MMALGVPSSDVCPSVPGAGGCGGIDDLAATAAAAAAVVVAVVVGGGGGSGVDFVEGAARSRSIRCCLAVAGGGVGPAEARALQDAVGRLPHGEQAATTVDRIRTRWGGVAEGEKRKVSNHWRHQLKDTLVLAWRTPFTKLVLLSSSQSVHHIMYVQNYVMSAYSGESFRRSPCYCSGSTSNVYVFAHDARLLGTCVHICRVSTLSELILVTSSGVK